MFAKEKYIETLHNAYALCASKKIIVLNLG